MGLDSNLYEKSIKILTDLISFKTISGKDNGPLIDYCDDILKKMEFLLLGSLMGIKKG